MAPKAAPPPVKVGMNARPAIAAHSESFEPHEALMATRPLAAPTAAPIKTPFHADCGRFLLTCEIISAGIFLGVLPEPLSRKEESEAVSKRPLMMVPSLAVTLTGSPFCRLCARSGSECVGSWAHAVDTKRNKPARQRVRMFIRSLPADVSPLSCPVSC